MRAKISEKAKFQDILIPQNFTGVSTLYNGYPSAAGHAVDTQNYEEVLYRLKVGAVGAGASVAATIVASDNDTPGVASAISGASFTTVTNSNQNTPQNGEVAAESQARYQWLKIVVGGTTPSDGALIGADAILCKSKDGPQNSPTPTFDV